MLGKLAPYHRERLAKLVAATPEFNTADVDVAMELVDAALANPSSDDYRFVLFDEGERVLGYACFGTTPMTEGCFDLYWVVVDKDARRMGIGRKLLGAVESTLRAEGARLLRVETAGIASYRSARGLYEGTGYERAGHIRDFYWPGNDLYTYVKYLNQ